ncbi:TetR/AcrR family transcriptional regulator [Mycobacterium manitobense]|uniref:TetR/AcrR family transcriptional regulator n=1 Tax=[Mycobacterium] manitobense TaxID=190147 RepID=A0A9X2YPN6_9MYCO|nr:TetR/AcrR family transcriptional regulator [[Mycobacterium] manitobense]MCV7170397.1 TetR/AcrR family transcriptional regulator [[Mycobacterium] manitobense]
MTGRLSKQERRRQLLDTALAIVRDRGTDDLTLLTLAQAAGVSRPIVYLHFETRPGLLLALYRELDERHRAATQRALQDAGDSPGETARVMSTAYFSCATEAPEFTVISAALKGDPEMEALQHDMLDSYTDLMVRALNPHSSLPPAALRLCCVGILGAAEAIAAEMNRGATSVAAAVDALTGLIAAVLQSPTRT